MTKEEKKVIFASSLGTVFEWYDFYLCGSLAAIIAKQFFSWLDAQAAFIFALLAFAAGFIVRPFGAIVFGRLGDMTGRKYTFLVTILIMGLATFVVGLLPNYASIGVAAPIILIVLRMLQGLALGGEYGGAATYVAEHAPHGKRGACTSWIQTTATLGLFLSLMVILGTRTLIGEVAFADWGWRVPFLVSIALLAISVWIRLSMNKSPAFKKMKEEGKTSKAPLTESFGQWKNLKIVILALVGLTVGQAVVWYSGQFYALFFLHNVLKVDAGTAAILVAVSLIIGTPFFIVFGTLSDKIGRKPIIMAGLPGAAAVVQIGDKVINVPSATLAAGGHKFDEGSAKAIAAFKKDISAAMNAAGYPAKADPIEMGSAAWWKIVGILTILVLYVTMVYGPIAAMLVEMFPTRIRYTSMSLPYHIGNGWFGGLMPTIAFAMVAQNGNIYHGLWYPIVIATITLVIGMIFVRETKDRDIYAND